MEEENEAGAILEYGYVGFDREVLAFARKGSMYLDVIEHWEPW